MEVEVYQIIRDGEKERIQIFRGLVIGMRGSSLLSHTMTVRAECNGIGIEKVFPLHSPYIQKIVVLRKFQVRHKHIRFVRGLTGKAARLKEIKQTQEKSERSIEKKRNKEEDAINEKSHTEKVEST